MRQDELQMVGRNYQKNLRKRQRRREIAIQREAGTNSVPQSQTNSFRTSRDQEQNQLLILPGGRILWIAIGLIVLGFLVATILVHFQIIHVL